MPPITGSGPSLPRSAASIALCLGLCALLIGCTQLRSRDSGTPVADAGAESRTQDQECERLRAAIRDNERTRRQAPTTSIAPEIVAAAQAKADRNIEDLRQRYSDLDCPQQQRPPLLQAPPPPPPPGSPTH